MLIGRWHWAGKTLQAVGQISGSAHSWLDYTSGMACCLCCLPAFSHPVSSDSRVDVDTVTKQPTDVNQLYGLLKELPVLEKNKHRATGNKSPYKNNHKWKMKVFRFSHWNIMRIDVQRKPGWTVVDVCLSVSVYPLTCRHVFFSWLSRPCAYQHVSPSFCLSACERQSYHTSFCGTAVFLWTFIEKHPSVWEKRRTTPDNDTKKKKMIWDVQ